MAKQPPQVIEGDGQVGAPPLRLERQQVTDQAKRMAAALLGGDELFDPVGEQQQPDPIVVLDRGHRDHGCDLRGDLRLEAPPRAELLGA